MFGKKKHYCAIENLFAHVLAVVNKDNVTSDIFVLRTEVPEQLVVLDPGLAAVDENYVRILQRYKVKVLTVSRSCHL